MIQNFTFTDLSDISCTSHGGRFAVDTIEQSLKFCESIAKSHYENFPVASLLLPTSIRSHVIVIYAFSRIADDIADEYSLEYGKEKAEHALAIMHHFVKQSHVGGYKGKNPLWIALQHVFEKTSLPIAPFERLLNAFLSDVYFQFPATMNDLLEYCHNSANPIGELLLRLFGLWNTDIQKQSDSLCSALQIINFIHRF
jgi:phytoene/squalene synthetase